VARDTQPVFFVGSGRSGTRTIFKLFSGVEGVEIHHEYVCTHIQPVAALYAMGRISREDAARQYRSLHGAAIHYSPARLWIDCSNKLSWLIDPILDVSPRAKFVLIVRDGRKVSSSFFHKLSDEMYDDRSVAILASWLKDPGAHPRPPPEKKYWWNIPQPGQPFHEEFPGFDQFSRCCYHWREANRTVLDSFERLPPGQTAVFKLEEISRQEAALQRLVAFTGLAPNTAYFEFMQTPQNVIFPMDFKLTGEQVAAFERIAGDMQRQLGYEQTAEYRMKY
jgi:hypothetical protein